MRQRRSRASRVLRVSACSPVACTGRPLSTVSSARTINGSLACSWPTGILQADADAAQGLAIFKGPS